MSTALPVIGLTDEQKQARSQGVGASEAAAALGLDRYTSQQLLWLRKTRRAPPQEDAAVLRLGNIVEPFILDEYAREHGVKLIQHPPTYRKGRMLANLDAITDNDRPFATAVEAKMRGNRDSFGEAGTADVPDEIAMQVTAQMYLADLAVAHIPVLFIRPPVVTFEVALDFELAQMIEAGVDRFWWYVENDTPPPVNPDAPEALAALRLLYPGTTGERLQAPRELEAWRAIYHDSVSHRDRYATTAEAAKAHLLEYMKDASELAFADGTVFRRKEIDVKGYSVEPRKQIDARFIKPKG